MPSYRQGHMPQPPKQVSKIDLPKLPFIPSQRISEKMTDDQKRGVQMWNMMRQRLIDTGQMEDKRGG